MADRDLAPFKCIGSKTVYQNKWITVSEDSVIRPDGNDGMFGVVRMRPGSTVIALTAAGEVHLVKEYKYALGDVSLEAVSGAIEAGESPLDAAKRELEEELGLAAGRWTDLGILHPFTTLIDSPNHMFLAEDLSEGRSHPDEEEQLAIETVPFDTALTWVMESRITHGASCTALLKVAMVREARLR